MRLNPSTGALQSSATFPFFRFKLTPSVDEVEALDERESERAAAAGAGGAARERDRSSAEGTQDAPHTGHS